MNNNYKSTSIEELRIGIQIVEFQGHKVLALSGEISAYTATQFRQAVLSILDGTRQTLIIDMHNVRYMDGIGLSTLLSAMMRFSNNGGKLSLVGCKPDIERLLSIPSMSSFIILYSNLHDALNATPLQSSI